MRMVLFCLLTSSVVALAQGTKADYERSEAIYKIFAGKVIRDKVEPNWYEQEKRFWFRSNSGPGEYEFYTVDALSGKKEIAFDHDKFAKALAQASGKNVLPKRLPIVNLSFQNDKVRFSAFNKNWQFDPSTNSVSELGNKSKEKSPESLSSSSYPNNENIDEEPILGHDHKNRESSSDENDEDSTLCQKSKNVDNPYILTIKNHNVYIQSKLGGEEIQLTKDGTETDGYTNGAIRWSPDFSRVIVYRNTKGDGRIVTIVESSPKDQVQPKLLTYQYDKPGDKIPTRKPRLFDTKNAKEIPVSDDLFKNPYAITVGNWTPDGKEFTFEFNQRGHQAYRYLAIEGETGKVRTVINEEPKTFFDYAQKKYLNHNPNTNEIIWMSERDGWNHLYLIDFKTGEVKNQITKGEWVVRGVESVDFEKRELILRVGGIDPKQDPYYIHYIRIGFDGKNLVRLTESDGTHTAISFAPKSNRLVTTYSRVDLPPITELRELSTGKLISVIETADDSELLKTGWKRPERFVAKGRDGKTDIYGIIYRPSNFDPKKKYPVIENIYAGPHAAHVPKAYAVFANITPILELGFVGVRIDGMGTSHRSKAFHDVCWKNLGDAGFPDRILWIKAAAEKYPEMDLSRVGIYGGSAGGQNAMRALIAHGDFYKVAVADCGCHDNRMDKIWWNELWMSYPVGPHYKESSNVEQAHRMQGKLLLTVGELDRNVDPASTMQVVNALIKANKDFELLVIPGGGHGAGETPYAAQKRKDFFVRYLLGVEPRLK